MLGQMEQKRVQPSNMTLNEHQHNALHIPSW
jgi:hypothetical protein